MAHIFIAFVNTPGVFATMIHKYLKQKYIHVVISMDDKLEEAYSVGRRNPFIPILAGFEREDKNKIYKAFPKAEYMICKMKVSEEQRGEILQKLRNDYENRYSYHYAVAGLMPLVLGKAFHQKNHFTCSSYIAKLLQDNGICIANKHFSLITPKDFYLYPNMQKIFEGELKEFYMKKDGNRLGDSSVVLMVVALLYKFVLVIFGILMLLFWFYPLRLYLKNYFFVYLLGLALNIILVVILLGVMMIPGVMQKILLMAEYLLEKVKVLKSFPHGEKKSVQFVNNYQHAVVFLKNNKNKILAVTGMTFLQRLSVFF